VLLRSARPRKPTLERAQITAETAVRLNARSSDAWGALGNVLTAQLRIDEALDAFANAVTLPPGRLRTRASYARLLFALGRPDEALEQVRQGHLESPLDVGYRGFEAVFLYHLGDPDGAEKLLRKVPELPKFVRAAPQVLMHILDDRGDTAEAVELSAAIQQGQGRDDSAERLLAAYRSGGRVAWPST
jgi:tetratricopeptide (TPR) repeat protein